MAAGLVLAAGGGRRYGGPKALVHHEGSLLVERAVRTVRDAGCAPVVVVLGAAAAEVRASAQLGNLGHPTSLSEYFDDHTEEGEATAGGDGSGATGDPS